jgi:precorrin-3B methylase
MVGDAKAAMADADAAIRQKEYEKAVRTMLAIQQAHLNAQQAELARQQMANLQRNLASAVANGDPNAKAAADLIRAAHSH